jgi:CheY-like chemotaxis protein
MNLLIVEDHPTSRKLLRVQLEAEGHSVVEATDGRTALSILAQGTMDGVISDILMPGMDGFRLCYEIRKAPAGHSRIPVVLYTGTFFTPADQELAQSLGADAFIRKPASPAVILAALREGAENTARHSAVPMEGIADNYILEHYNGALVRKLEERNTELQQSLTQIHRAHEVILDLNHTLEARIAQRTTALEAANAELESISRAVAHELRAPLQAICAHAQNLEQIPATASDQDCREYATRIVAAARHMNQLVDALSDFIRLGRTALNRSTLDLDTLVDEAIATVRLEAPQRNIQWERQTLPRARGDPALLRQVLVSLIANSMRYTRGRQPAVIEIGSRRGRADELVVFVRDNGLSPEARGAGSLLDTLVQTDNPGLSRENQLRLANAYRIVARHGGRMWSEVAAGCGATYFFSLPQHNGQDTRH